MSLQKVTDTEFSQLLAHHPKVVVKYYADWCGSCRLVAPKYNKMAADAGEDVLFLDVNAEENPEARRAAGVTNLPFFAVFKDGQLAEGVNTSRIELLEEIIANHLN
ncbi:MAG: thioredoxin family protein [Bacteroidetes bacterium]|nr:thioredoxin family protein [Bacteroidota bacterium]